MLWHDIHSRYPNQWMIVEALTARTDGSRRLIDEMAVVELREDGGGALQRYRELHRQHPEREFYYLHTSREELDIHVRPWRGIRASYSAHAS